MHLKSNVTKYNMAVSSINSAPSNTLPSYLTLILYLGIGKISEKRSCFRKKSQTSNVSGEIISRITTFMLTVIFIHYILSQVSKNISLKGQIINVRCNVVVPPYPWGIRFKTPSGYLNLWLVPNAMYVCTYTLFLLY